MSQLSHNTHLSSPTKFPIVVMTDNLMGEANIGSLFRLADAFNIEKLVFTGTPVNLNSNRLKRTARATIKNIEFEEFEDAAEALEKFLSKDFTPFALELTSDSKKLQTVDFSKIEKILLIAGNERHGISDALLEKINNRIYIEMFGNNSSMNVAQATGIALYEITKTVSLFQDK